MHEVGSIASFCGAAADAPGLQSGWRLLQQQDLVVVSNDYLLCLPYWGGAYRRFLQRWRKHIDGAVLLARFSGSGSRMCSI